MCIYVWIFIEMFMCIFCARDYTYTQSNLQSEWKKLKYVGKEGLAFEISVET